MQVFIANVGANRSTAPRLRSPLFSDGTFEFVPILDEGVPGAMNPTYEELPSETGRAPNLAAFVHPSLRQRRAHADPEFVGFTYGDCWNGRSSNLFSARAGDVLLFLARLWEYEAGRWGAHAFYLVAKFVIAYIVDIAAGEDPTALERRVGPSVIRAIARNANHQRIVGGERVRSIVVVGDPARSCRFQRALRVDEEVVGLIYGGEFEAATGKYVRDGSRLANRNGRPRRFDTFGSATRAIQPWLVAGHDDDYLNELLARTDRCVGPVRSDASGARSAK